ncbi:PHP domain-containing protein [Anaeromicropila herbilytica]|uniref:Phosphatase n=1 Tax=Anaeromicropila herbilytica TaxID=2785025 RepID=A0A7R7IBT0_9FIRM|nr:PHP domain-containing protein [Anaeromicropila herbilytica]BCN29917.1 phosphatase [Anaeromicropila herbilytica]
MKYIDLHVHSNVSDGTLTPKEVVEKAVKMNLAAFALTDHDTVMRISEALNAVKEYQNNGIDLELIPGVEISVAYKSKDIHMLGLFLDYQNETLISELQAVVNDRENRNIKMIANLQNAGIDITLEKLVESEGDSIITRAHFAKYLLEHSYVKSREEAFKKYLGEDGPYYVPRKFITPEKGIELIKAAGGIPVLAHPLLYKLPPKELDSLISRLKNAGLVGIETIYSANVDFDESYVRKLANKYDLLITGGSDFHGANKPLIEMGIGKGNLRIPYSILEKLKEYLTNK